MTNKEKFKEFAKKNPEFAHNVRNGKTSWQELYEIYDMYGEETNLWDKYRKVKKTDTIANSIGVKEIINSLKGINIDSLQENLNGLQKAVGFIEDITNTFRKKEDEPTKKKTKKTDNTIERFFDD